MQSDSLDNKLTQVFAGKAVRKDLLHQIKGGENVPSYVLEYLLGKYCASDDENEIRAGIDAVKETLKSNYFRHDEANKAQSLVEQHGKHRFIDRIYLLQLSTRQQHAVIDPLPIGRPSGLGKLLEDPKVEVERPFADVFDVQLDHAFERQVAAAVDLPQTRDAGQHARALL